MSKQEDRWNVLYEVRQVTQSGNWVTFDTETTGLDGEIIQWAVCDAAGAVLGSGYVKPTCAIEDGARAIHGISDEQLVDAPRFGEVAPAIWRLLEGRHVVIYNAAFDLARLDTSLTADAGEEAYRNEEIRARREWLWHLSHDCAMEWFAVIYGQKHSYYRTYTWQRLETACAHFAIPHAGAHDAASDARMTALLVQKLREMAEKELPTGYHPARDEACAGGCGQTLGPFTWDEDHTWYCLECGLAAGFNRLCPRCEERGKRTIVTERKEKQAVTPGMLCYQCRYETNVASGVWHLCPGCTRLIERSAGEQLRCEWCEKEHVAWEAEQARRKEHRRQYQKEYRKSRKASSPPR